MDPGLTARSTPSPDPWSFPTGPGLTGLRGRTLIHTNPTDLKLVDDLIDPHAGGIILTGRGNSHRGVIRTHSRRLPVMRDAGAHHRRPRHRPNELFELSDNLFGSGLAADLDQQLANGFCTAITPTRYIPADHRLTLETVIEAIDDLARDDTLCLLPLSLRWLSGEFLKRLDHALRYAITPVGILFPHPRINDPHGRAPVELHHLLTDHPGTGLLSTDLTGLAAVARSGALASIGVPRPSWFAPVRLPSDTEDSPHVLVPKLLQWFTTATLRDLATRGRTFTCDCQVCLNGPVHRLNCPVTVLRHNTARVSEWASRLRLAPDPAGWWRGMCLEALNAFEELPWYESLRPHHTMLDMWSRG